MGLPSGTRSGNGILLLSKGREIARDNLWALRLLVALVFIGPLLAEALDPYGRLALGEYTTGMAVILPPLYWMGLRALSKPGQADNGADGPKEEGNTPSAEDSGPGSGAPRTVFTTTQRVLYWVSAVCIFLLMIATTPDIGIVTDPAESLGALFGTVVIWAVAAPAVKRRWGHQNDTVDASAS